MEADVRSIDAVRDWHATLANYTDSLSEALAGVEMEIRRAYEWLDEQLALWRQAIRDCEEEVVRAKAELSQRKFKTWDGRDPDCTVQERALRRAKARLEHAEEQVEKVRHWIGRLPKIIDETYRGAGRRLQNLLEDDVPKGQADLARRIVSLETYAGLRPDFASSGSGSGVVAAPNLPVTAQSSPTSLLGKGEKTRRGQCHEIRRDSEPVLRRPEERPREMGRHHRPLGRCRSPGARREGRR